MDEFKVITALGLMQYINPEEIARAALLEIKGVNTSKDLLGAIAGAVMGPTYRAGCLRDRVIKRMETLGNQGVAYGSLGPRIAKLVLEGSLIKSVYGFLEKALQASSCEMSQVLDKRIQVDHELRVTAISLGLPILLSDGKTLLYAKRVHPDKGWESQDFLITRESIEKWALLEWNDLRSKNMSQWQDCFRSILEDSERSLGDTSSLYERGTMFWTRNKDGEIIIDPGEVVGWILTKENSPGLGRTFPGLGIK